MPDLVEASALALEDRGGFKFTDAIHHQHRRLLHAAHIERTGRVASVVIKIQEPPLKAHGANLLFHTEMGLIKALFSGQGAEIPFRQGISVRMITIFAQAIFRFKRIADKINFGQVGQAAALQTKGDRLLWQLIRVVH